MKIELSTVYDPKKTESRIYNFWQKTGFFNPDKLPGKRKKTFTIVLPPPNITGELHIGHALNAVVQDILIRHKRMQGFKTLWLPGTDHAGIATQNVVEKELKKQNLSRFDLGREKFIEQVWQWREKYGNIILEQFKKMGCSLDWSRTKFTLDKDYSLAVITAFLHYYKKGWIYRGKRVINWCPRCQTSLSDLEIEYKTEKGSLYYIRYPLKKQKGKKIKTRRGGNFASIVVATTRPETMLGDTAVAVNPKDARYKNLVKEKALVLLPLINREIPLVANKLVNPKFGSGAVKVTPAHDLIDYEIGLAHNLKSIQVIDEMGRITTAAPLIYQGLKVAKARQKIVEDLKEQKFLEKIEPLDHQVPHCERCHTTIEILPSKQWFLKMDKLAKVAEKAVKKGKVKFYPKNFEKIYFDWLKNIKDWCISRQIWWGHQLPIWQCQMEKNTNSQTINTKLKRNYFISLEKPKKCLFCAKCQPKQVLDVLDTWFSSALWPFAVFGWPQKTSDLKIFYPTDVLSTARDIINLWVARMVFSGIEFIKKPPFHTVLIHPTVLTQEGKRMSKSLGTGIDPIGLVEKYGADALRFGIAYQLMGGQDIKFSENNIVVGRKFCNKLWNASRFVLMQFKKNSKISLPPNNKSFAQKQNLTSADKRILKFLAKTIKSVNKELNSFRFGKAVHTLYKFFWHDFCDIYIEKSKKQLSDKLHPDAICNTKEILLCVLLNLLKLLCPFIPFITEEIYQKLPIKNKKKSLMVEQWPK